MDKLNHNKKLEVPAASHCCGHKTCWTFKATSVETHPGFCRIIQSCNSFAPVFLQDTLRDCAHETSTCYNTVVSPIYFVSFVLTAQFVLVNVVIAVLMKHLEESNKEAKEEAELEAELELENRLQAEEMATRSPQLNPLALGMDRSSSGGSPWRSPGRGDGEQEGGGPMDSPTADITRDSVDIREDPTPCEDPPLEVIDLSVLHACA